MAKFHVERSVEKHLEQALLNGSRKLGIELDTGEVERLGRYLDLLLLWNRKINLTAIRDPAEAVEGHLLDALAAVGVVRGARTVLDLGAGGGIPSLPLAVMVPQTEFVLVDAVGKKVGFLKAAIAALGLTNARAIHARAEGRPGADGIPRSEMAICRAFLPLQEWIELASHYVEGGGRIAAMLGPEAVLEETPQAGIRLTSVKSYLLPESGAQRRIAVFSVG